MADCLASVVQRTWSVPSISGTECSFFDKQSLDWGGTNTGSMQNDLELAILHCIILVADQKDDTKLQAVFVLLKDPQGKKLR